MSIKYKLYGLCIALLLALLFSCNTALVFMEDINDATNAISQDWLPSVIIAEELNTNTSNFRNAAIRHILAQDRASMDVQNDAIIRRKARIESLFIDYKQRHIKDEGDKRIIEQLELLWAEYLVIHRAMMALSSQNKTIEAVRALEESKLIFDNLSNVCLNLVEFNKKGADNANLYSDKVYNNTKKALIMVMVSTVIFGILTSYIFINKVIKPVEEVQKAAAQIARGNLSTEIKHRSDDELGDLAGNMRTLSHMFQSMIGDLSQLLRKLSDGDFTAKSQKPELYIGEFSALLEFTESISGNLNTFLNNNKKLEVKSQQDSLTKLYNAGYFHEYAEEKVVQLDNGCLILIDIDFFKDVNDTHGHQAGDTVLKNVAKTLEKQFRSNDIIARLGGDEFVILLEKEVAKEFLEERCKNILEELSAEHHEVPVSLSIGGYIFKEPKEYKDLYKLADEILYKVKEKGRNGFEFTSCPTA